VYFVVPDVPTSPASALADIASAPVRDRATEDAAVSRTLAIKDVFDRIGYGGATPQVVSVLFWLSIQTHPLALFLIGVLIGAKTLLSVIWSNLLTEYARLSKVPKSWIAAGGVVFGFLFIIMTLALLMHSVWLFSGAFLLSALCIVAYGDLYGAFTQEILRRERRGAFLRSIATWGVLITVATMLLSGFLIDVFPSSGTPFTFSLFGHTFSLQVYGHLLAFEITAFAVIISGYVTSFIKDQRTGSGYPFGKFIGEYARLVRAKTAVFWLDGRVMTLTIGGVILSLLQTALTAYTGIALYRILASRYPTAPFFALAVVLSIAAVAAFTGPFFTQKAHRSTGLAPTLVFGTLLMAILPIALIYKTGVAALAAALCANVIGAAIVGFAQGMLAHQLLPDDRRHEYFQAQWVAIVIPYLILIPVLSLLANSSLTLLFWIIAVGLVAVVMPLHFILVLAGQRSRS